MTIRDPSSTPGDGRAYGQSAEVGAIRLVHPSTPMEDAPYEPAEKPDPGEYMPASEGSRPGALDG